MNRDPFSVLGVRNDATDDEIKKAYRSLAKKYHPDNFADSPLKAQAEEKMKEINDAYDRIQKIRSGKGDYTDYGGTSSSTGSKTGIYYTVRVYINSRRYSEADSILDSVAVSDRTAEWHFLKGIVYYSRGWYFDAESSVQTACDMDPGNAEYRQTLSMMQNRANNGGRAYTTTMSSNECAICDICSTLMCANCLCNCCCGGGC